MCEVHQLMNFVYHRSSLVVRPAPVRLPSGPADTVGRPTRSARGGPSVVQGVIKSYDPGTGDGVMLCDTDFAEYDLAADALDGSLFRMLRQGQRVVFDLDDRRPGHPAPARLRGRHGDPRASRRPRHPRQPPEPTNGVGGGPPRDRTHQQREAAGLGRGVAQVFEPDDVTGATARAEEYDRLCQLLVDGGTFERLSDAKRPNSYLALSDPGDVARVEDRTFICSEQRGRRRPHQQLARPGRDEGRRSSASTAAPCGAARCTWCRSRWARSARRSPTSACSSPTRPTSP